MDVSVVIVSYNSKDLFKNCLESVYKFTKDLEFEVIVVDNASTDGVTDYLKSQISPASPELGRGRANIKDTNQKSNLKAIFSEENLGFSRGNNVGIKEAKGKYVLLLNNDTELLENSIERMKLWMDAHQDVAVVSCQLVNSEHKASATGGFFPRLHNVIAWGWFLDDLPILRNYFPSYHPHPGPMYDKEQFLDWVTGAFFFVRKAAIDQVGMFDENIFMYGEELEWCIRFKKAGWKIGYTPITKVVHHERGSQGGLPKGAILGEFRGLKYIYGKHYPGWMQVALGTVLDVAAFLRVVLWLVRLKPQMAKIFLEALLL
ncbi:hypothetical protein A2721_00220 [Candidatus Gottesmanbacteria bacterium RIFCSPHIGHO2_01_FULL_47_48]|uniref:Glycosyltransferase 2-like domain-containing protein n=1 Tax=Candidatus Gottesmanbacteria bacterium RIFCSPHIGHO2_01_FULL_47_48 TaxID=1798381 RepID=A0A1F6A408_9BACT|nr:MAG: hypothetical protein A2721_00220 [Candidatus Gottesmanbacteria bacterium RIFCSPHIGHO2_01_FULL_47_48]